MLTPPSRARTPDSGTATPASSTPWEAAQATVRAEKCPNDANTKIVAKRTLPTGTMNRSWGCVTVRTGARRGAT
ncbi:MAG: hypothetical protein JW940_36030 [Polyangiaceae bacterium]|nr:hypothetical protein [Polyangiaceae bacterium]